MSPSELDGTGIALIVDKLRLMSAGKKLSATELGELVGAIAQIYSEAVTERGREISITRTSLDATAAVVLSCALLRSQDLSPFDLAIWFGSVVPDNSTV